MRITGRIAMAMSLGAPLAMAAEPAPALPDPANAMWAIKLHQLFGVGQEAVNRDYNLNIYSVVRDGKFVHGLGSARRFNTSVHLVEKSDLVFAGTNVSGRMSVLMTPDQWVPKNHQPVGMDVELKGFLYKAKDEKDNPAWRLGGTYKAVIHGSSAGPGPDRIHDGGLTGGVEAFDPAWENAAAGVLLTPIPREGDPTDAGIVLDVGYADGKVNWATLGHSWTKNARSGRHYPFDVSGIALRNERVSGAFRIPYRAIEIACDPGDEAEVNLVLLRVQGMTGAKMSIAVRRDGKVIRTYDAYGKGFSATKGAGGPRHSLAAPLWDHKINVDPWWAPVKDFTPPGPGEHPRLLFRKADVPALRKKAETAEGKAILARLRLLLDGANGDTLPTVFNTTAPDNHDQSAEFKPGAFTTWHGAGYGFLYQLTGEAKYAELARQAVQLCFDGKIDVDNRYAWFMPGTVMRAGSLLTGIAMAYDFCYDAWPEPFRRQVALEMQGYDKPCAPSGGEPSKERVTLFNLVTCGGYPPGSNHYGAYLGAGVAVLAILGDPGTDAALLNRYLAYAEAHAVHMVTQGFGDGGFYPEGHHPCRVSANAGYLEFVTALRNAAGRDYGAAQPNVSWITLRWLMETGMDLSFMHRGVYGGDSLESGGMSHDGEIPYGFATIPEKLKPAWLWFYHEAYRKRHDHWGAATYPHRAVYSFVFWPVGVAPVNPGDLLPLACADTVHGYFYHRKSWRDNDDIIVTHCMDTGPAGYYELTGGGKEERGCWLKGLGFHRVRFPAPRGTVTAYEPGADGSSVIAAWTGGPTPASLAVDFSGASGADALLVSVGPDLADALPRAEKRERGAVTPMEIKAGGLTFNLLALHRGGEIKPEVAGDTIRVGQQTIRFDGKRLVLGVFGAK